MRIEIRKKGNHTAVLISFDTQQEKFVSPSERNRFFTELYGRNQTIKGPTRKYEYHREGVMDQVPHLKVDSSVFIVMQENMRMMEQFFKEWEDKVMFKTFPVLLTGREIEDMKKRAREVKIE